MPSESSKNHTWGFAKKSNFQGQTTKLNLNRIGHHQISPTRSGARKILLSDSWLDQSQVCDSKNGPGEVQF